MKWLSASRRRDPRQASSAPTPDPLWLPEEVVEVRLQWSVPRLGSLLASSGSATGRLVVVSLALMAAVRDLWRWRRRHRRQTSLTPQLAGGFVCGAATAAWIAAAADLL